MTPRRVHPTESARALLLAAAIDVIRRRGLHATTVDELCSAAGVTKGAFFHHFESKEALAVAAAEYWGDTTAEMFAAAPYHQPVDAVARIDGYLAFRAALVAGPPEQFTCLVGTMAQEAFSTQPLVRDACGRAIVGHAATLEADFVDAIAAHCPHAGVTAHDLALHTQVVLQGAFVVAKATDDPGVVTRAIDHLRRYLRLLFGTDALPTALPT